MKQIPFKYMCSDDNTDVTKLIANVCNRTNEDKELVSKRLKEQYYCFWVQSNDYRYGFDITFSEWCSVWVEHAQYDINNDTYKLAIQDYKRPYTKYNVYVVTNDNPGAYSLKNFDIPVSKTLTLNKVTFGKGVPRRPKTKANVIVKQDKFQQREQEMNDKQESFNAIYESIKINPNKHRNKLRKDREYADYALRRQLQELD